MALPPKRHESNTHQRDINDLIEAVADVLSGPAGVQGDQGPRGPQGHQGVRGYQGYQGYQGFQGPSDGYQGVTGDQGPQGDRGYQGYQGLTGPQGVTGAQGPQGTRGWQGDQGDQGVVGAQGSTGATGAQGDQGVTGAQGAQGAAGAQGAVGAQGEVGAQGDQGVVGAQGAQGVAGVQGAQGAIGAQGDPGVTGAQGDQGATGAQGAVGAQGEEGAQGDQGVTGAQGDQGATGAQGVTGAQGAKGDQGEQGTAGAQGDQGAIGPQGLQGAQGSTGGTGDTGPAGAQGPQGEIGAQGPTGNQGAQGAVGAQGATGAQGDQGEEGAQGVTGAQGAQGQIGAQGPTGAQGDQGETGDQGVTGAQGSQGAVGAQGSVGEQGETGAQGVTGAQGSQGEIGAQGPTGAQGDQGVVGAQGVTGAQGAQGQIGAQGSTGATGAQGDQGAQGATGLLGDALASAVTIESGGYFKIGTGDLDDDLTGLVLNDKGMIGQQAGVDQLALGNIRTRYGIGAQDTVGVGIGDYASGNYLRFDPVNGLVFRAADGGLQIDETAMELSAAAADQDAYYLRWNNGDGVVAGMNVYTTALRTVAQLVAAVPPEEGDDSQLWLVSRGVQPEIGNAHLTYLLLRCGDTAFDGSLTVAIDELVALYVDNDQARFSVDIETTKDISAEGVLDLKEQASAPDAPGADIARIFAKDDSSKTRLYFKDADGAEKELGSIDQGCRVYRSTNQSISHNTLTALSFSSEAHDTDGCWASGDPTKLYARHAGYYMAGGQIHMTMGANAADVIAAVREGGANYKANQGMTAVANKEISLAVATGMFWMDADDYVEIVVRQIQASGSAAVNVSQATAQYQQFNNGWLQRIA